MSYINLQSGILHLDAEITWDNATALLITIRELDNDPTVDKITLHVSSLGGLTLAAVAIAQALANCNTPVHTVGTGYVASSAVLVLAAGHAPHRSLTEGCGLMLHAPRLPRPEQSQLTAQAMRDFVQAMETKTALYFDEMARATAQPSAFWRKELRDDRPDWFVSPEEAVTLKLVDQVVTAPRRLP